MARDLGRALEKAGPFTPNPDVRESRESWIDFRHSHGRVRRYAALLTADDENEKLAKSDLPSYSLSLAHAATSGEWNVCRFSTPGCRRGCVADSGNGNYPDVRRGRTIRTLFLGKDPQAFVDLFHWELGRAVDRHGLIGNRFNAFADLAWWRIAPALFERGLDELIPYDYSKRPIDDLLDIPDHYRVVWSASERSTDVDILAAAERFPVAVVFPHDEPLPYAYLGLPVVDGDLNDERWLDVPGTIVGLRAKGHLKTQEGRKSLFIRRPERELVSA